MTISILAFDAKTGRMGGAAATGSLCVGGWVLRGNARAGLSASQGTAPSTLWGEGVLEAMAGGLSAEAAVAATVAPDPGRAHRQLAALDTAGGTGAFTGGRSVPHAGAAQAPRLVVAGNMLTGPEVIAATRDAFIAAASLPLAPRLLHALMAAQTAGGDARGLKSAALLVVGRTMAPLTLRIDHSANPLESLADLYRVSQTDPYRSWTEVVPVLDAPYRAPADADVPDTPEPIVAPAPMVPR